MGIKIKFISNIRYAISKFFARIRNKKLIKRYPFIEYKDYVEKPGKHYYDSTHLDCLPSGWRKSFVPEMLERIRNVLLRQGEDALKNYSLEQVKEKWGSLRWYDYGGNDEIDEIISYYEDVSMSVCIQCGKRHSKYITSPYVCFICEKCLKKHDNLDSRELTWDNIPRRTHYYEDGSSKVLESKVDFKSIWKKPEETKEKENK